MNRRDFLLSCVAAATAMLLPAAKTAGICFREPYGWRKRTVCFCGPPPCLTYSKIEWHAISSFSFSGAAKAELFKMHRALKP